MLVYNAEIMNMTPRIDLEARDYGRINEQPIGRFGENHIPRDEIPAINPEIIDLLEKQEDAERALIAQERRGQIAVADTVKVDAHFYL